MDYFRGFTIFRDDPEWSNKLLVGAVLALTTLLIPIIGQLVIMGWATLLLRQAVRGQPLPMPPLRFDVEQWIKLLGIGFKPFAVAFVWSLPAMLLSCIIFGCGYGISIAAVTAAGSGAEAGPFAGLCLAASGLLALPVAILFGLPAAAAGLRTALTDDFSHGLQFGAVIEMCKATLRELLVGAILLTLVAALLSIVLCGVGGLILATPIAAAYALFLAQIYERWLQVGGEALPVAPHDLEGGGTGAGTPGGGGFGSQLPPQGAGPYNQPPG